MAWMTPTIVEICIGLQFNGYLPPAFEQYMPATARPDALSLRLSHVAKRRRAGRRFTPLHVPG